jgi:hypothetical protein
VREHLVAADVEDDVPAHGVHPRLPRPDVGPVGRAVGCGPVVDELGQLLVQVVGGQRGQLAVGPLLRSHRGHLPGDGVADGCGLGEPVPATVGEVLHVGPQVLLGQRGDVDLRGRVGGGRGDVGGDGRRCRGGSRESRGGRLPGQHPLEDALEQPLHVLVGRPGRPQGRLQRGLERGPLVARRVGRTSGRGR